MTTDPREAVAGWRDAEALSRTGAVKVLTAKLEEIRARVEKTMCATWSSDGGDQGEQGRISRQDFDTLILSATAAPEGQQEPVAIKEYGAWDGLDGLDDLPDGTMLYTRPSEQAVTEAMVEVAAKAVVAEWQKMVAETSPHMSPGDHARAFVSPGNYRLIRAALKAAMEAGG